jgi:hypothetical protein
VPFSPGTGLEGLKSSVESEKRAEGDEQSFTVTSARAVAVVRNRARNIFLFYREKMLPLLQYAACKIEEVISVSNNRKIPCPRTDFMPPFPKEIKVLKTSKPPSPLWVPSKSSLQIPSPSLSVTGPTQNVPRSKQLY